MRNPLLPLAFLAALASLAKAQEPPPRCGTATHFNARSIVVPFQSGKGGMAARAAAGTKLSGRTLVTAHFAIHYTLGWNTHIPAWKTGDAGDAQLKAKRDSLYGVYQASNPSLRDSLINAAFDAQGAPHPVFVTKAAAYFENAFLYDRDSLGMRVPDSNYSPYFQKTVPGKYNVDIADIDALMSGYEGTYGLTFPQDSANYSSTMLVENDFRYDAGLNAGTGAVNGTSIKVYETDSTGTSSLLHDYGIDWDAGLAVTVAHEFYHAVQFQYTPGQTSYHAWYELTAVGMEERLAPTVNDYLGYLPYVLAGTTPTYLLSPPGSNVNYGNGIFHMFLTQKLGKAFDAVVWQRLSTNGNDLATALVQSVGSAARWDSLYAAYAASLAIAGRPGSQNSALAFSADFPRWPRPRVDTAKSTPSSLTLSRLTYRLVKPVSAAVTWASSPGIAGSWRVAQNGTTFSSQYFPDSLVPVAPNGTVAQAIANSSFSQVRTLALKRGAAVMPNVITAYPNPAPLSSTQIQFSNPTSGATAALGVVSESGRRVATLTADVTGSFWTWNFRDPQNRVLPPGLYYYGLPGEAPQTLLVLP